MELLKNKLNKERWFNSNEQFNTIYPSTIQDLSRRHWTPLEVARKAATYLSSPKNSRILDIGSGVGKFCLSAAYFRPNCFFYGVEQRQNLVEYAEKARVILGLNNVSFINANFTQLNFKNYDHFYFYNSFYENLIGTDKIDDSIEYSSDLYHYYNKYLFKQLEQKPIGTKIVTYHSLEEEVPEGYVIVDTDMNHLLKYWIKI
jgi:SAM-dependent methyltransferase